ncbi:MAG: valine--tRNA ligase, partial [Oscillospiraceae bacterium]|nr:valine--tRNA ligase [Oscillospiraceae bacterium]
YLIKIEDMAHNVGACYRCSTTVEPRVSKQWFVRMEPLAKPAIEAVRSGKTKFIPERFDKTYFHWMENIKDWCISRQLWWGHRIPAWYCEECGEVIVSRTDVTECPHCHSHKLHQDEDTLDTWFSSALWPFSTLGWPNKTPELEYFYPTDTLVTGYDIIFFWVSRMIFSGIENMGETPFNTVFIHGIVRDSEGRKMSKSLGNGIDPLEVIDQYGADALRFTLANGNTPGNDMRYSDEKVKASRNFANKIWNATRFILMNLSENILDAKLPQTLEIEDKWVISKYNSLVRDVTENLEKFELGLAVSKLYDFIWDILCDWYIELTKSRTTAGGETAENAGRVLVYIMSNTLKLLHPFMPFITEEIWSVLPHEGENDSIMLCKWPEYNEAYNFAEEETEFERVMTAIKGIRNRRAEMNVPPSKKAKVFIETEYADTFSRCVNFFTRLASASEVEVMAKCPEMNAVSVVTDSAKIFIPLDELVDKDKEIARLKKEKEVCEKDIKMFEGKLSNEGFIAKAPAKVIEEQRTKLANLKERVAKINESINSLMK